MSASALYVLVRVCICMYVQYVCMYVCMYAQEEYKYVRICIFVCTKYVIYGLDELLIVLFRHFQSFRCQSQQWNSP